MKKAKSKTTKTQARRQLTGGHMTRPGSIPPPNPPNQDTAGRASPWSRLSEIDRRAFSDFSDRVMSALGQAAERMAQLESRINQIELRLEGMKSPAWSEVERLQKELVQIRVFADHAETRIASIADKAGFVPSEFVDKPTWNGWRHGFDERLRALERKVGT